MPEDKGPPAEGAGVEAREEIDFVELCRICDLSESVLREFVQHGLLEPETGEKPEAWRFRAEAVRRVQVALRLRRDLEVNAAGAALAVDLLDEIEELRTRVRVLERQVRTTPHEES